MEPRPGAIGTDSCWRRVALQLSHFGSQAPGEYVVCAVTLRMPGGAVPGASYWTRVVTGGPQLRAVLVSTRRDTRSGERTYVLAIPCEAGTDASERRSVPSTQGSHRLEVRLVVVDRLQGRPRAPQAGVSYLTWGEEDGFELSPRLDALEALTARAGALPVGPERVAFELSPLPRRTGALSGQAESQSESEADGSESESDPRSSPSKQSALTQALQALTLQGQATQEALLALTEQTRRERETRSAPRRAFGEADSQALAAAAALAGEPPRLSGGSAGAGDRAVRESRSEAQGVRSVSVSDSADAWRSEAAIGGMERAALTGFRPRQRDRDREEDGSDEELGMGSGAGRKTAGIRKLKVLQTQFSDAPGSRWQHVVRECRQAGCPTVEGYLSTCTSMTRDRHTLLLGTMFARIGTAAAAGRLEEAAGLAAGGLMYLDQVSLDGNVETAWNLTLTPEPAWLRRNPETPPVRPWPSDPKQRKKKLARSQFSQLAEMGVMEAALAAPANWVELRKSAEGLTED